MTTPGPAELPRRVRWALHLTTARWRPPAALSVDEQDTLQQAERSGWWFRQASPRWDTIWHPSRAHLLRFRVILLPARGFGMPLANLLTLCRSRLASSELISDPSESAVLASLERNWSTRMAPAWLTDAADHGTGRRDRR